MKGWESSYFCNLLKATRIYRTIPVFMVILVSAAFANLINKELFILSLACIFIYSAAGIQNSVKDKDHNLPDFSKKIVLLLFVMGFMISLTNYIVFLTVISWIILGLIYNTISRFILFFDVTILSITHFALPSLSASVLLGLSMQFAFILSSFLFVTSWFIIHSKNLKDTLEDKKRGYATLTTKFKCGTKVIKIFLIISVALIILSYFLFNLQNNFILFIIIIFILLIIILRKIDRRKNSEALKISRFIILIFMFGLVLNNTSNQNIISISSMLVFLYLIYYLAREEIKNGF